MPLMTSLSVGVSGLRNHQNAINTTSHNLSNVNTPGYVRQQVVMADTAYVTISEGAVNYNQVGVGVDLQEIRRVRDELLDKAFRQENGREAFYERQQLAIDEVEEIFGELQGVSYQDYLERFWNATQEMAKNPSDTSVRSALVQSAVSFIHKSNAIYDELKNYQKTLDVAVTNMVDRINEIGAEIEELNQSISSIESLGIERANDYRDRRDYLLDELSGYVNIKYNEDNHGMVSVKVEGVSFVSTDRYYPMGLAQLDTDKDSLLVTPVWPHLDDNTLYNLQAPVSAYRDDIGGLKGLLLARGNSDANYLDIPDYTDYVDGKETDEYKAALEKAKASTIMLDGEDETTQDYIDRVQAAQDAIDPDLYNKAYQRDLQNAENTVNRGQFTNDADYQVAVAAAQQPVINAYAAGDYTGGRRSVAYLKDMEVYRGQVEQSSIRTVMAEFDQLVNAVVEKMNDFFSPNEKLDENIILYEADGVTPVESSSLYMGAYDGTTGGFISTIKAGSLVLDAKNAGYGADGDKTQGTELFERSFTERYTEISGYQKGTIKAGTIEIDGTRYDVDPKGNILGAENTAIAIGASDTRTIQELDEFGNLQDKEFTYYVYNTHNSFGYESLYSLENMTINDDILQDYSLIPLSRENGEVDMPTAEELTHIWEEANLRLTPDHNTQRAFKEYYSEFTGQVANAGNFYTGMVDYQEMVKGGIEDRRQGIMGTSSDEELSNLIKYQAGYNASSRYITVVDSMLEHLITRLA